MSYNYFSLVKPLDENMTTEELIQVLRHCAESREAEPNRPPGKPLFRIALEKIEELDEKIRKFRDENCGCCRF